MPMWNIIEKLPFPVVNAEKARSQSSKSSRMMKPSHLPLYENPEDILNYEYIVKKESSLENGIGSVRQELQSAYDSTRDTRNQVSHIIETGKAHSMSTYDQIVTNDNVLGKVGVMTVGSLLGLLVAGKSKSILKKISYASLGLGVSGAFVYPKKCSQFSSDVYNNGGDYAVIAYNFVAGVKPQSSAESSVLPLLPSQMFDGEGTADQYCNSESQDLRNYSSECTNNENEPFFSASSIESSDNRSRYLSENALLGHLPSTQLEGLADAVIGSMLNLKLATVKDSSPKHLESTSVTKIDSDFEIAKPSSEINTFADVMIDSVLNFNVLSVLEKELAEIEKNNVDNSTLKDVSEPLVDHTENSPKSSTKKNLFEAFWSRKKTSVENEDRDIDSMRAKDEQFIDKAEDISVSNCNEEEQSERVVPMQH